MFGGVFRRLGCKINVASLSDVEIMNKGVAGEFN